MEETSSLMENLDSFKENVKNRKQLRWSITGLWCCNLFVVFLSIIFLSATFGFINQNSPIYIGPYSTNDGLTSCIFTRLYSNYSSSDIACADVGFCPSGWSCAVLPDSPTLVCLNMGFECNDPENCYDFVSRLPATEVDGKPVVESDVSVSNGSLVTALVLLLFSGIAILVFWVLYEVWIYASGDPFGKKLLGNEWDGESTSSQLSMVYSSSPIPNILETKPIVLYSVIACIVSVLMALGFIAIIVFITGITPRAAQLASDSTCVTDHQFYEATTALVGWSVILCCSFLLISFVLGLFFVMFFTEKFYKIWKPHIFFFVCGLIGLVLILAVCVETLDAIL